MHTLCLINFNAYPREAILVIHLLLSPVIQSFCCKIRLFLGGTHKHKEKKYFMAVPQNVV